MKISTDDSPATRERGKSSRKKSHNSRNDLFMDSCFSFIVGEERLEAYVEDSELATNRTGETTATNLLKMTFTNKLFGFFFLPRSALVLAVRNAAEYIKNEKMFSV